MTTVTSDIQLMTATQLESHSFDWGNLTWFANRSLANATDFTVGRCLLKPGQGNPRHYHPNCSETLVVIQGKIRHTVAGGTQAEMQKDDTVTIPPNVWHQATNIGTEEAILFIVFSSADRETIGE